ncbi:MAG: TetR family transcriptional regulator C-terminal domain-containing protein [Myxococcales bacterium]|nr:TetR family transcriptional regulator C-terminal domain-containing protein [Myxococcales bacterium]
MPRIKDPALEEQRRAQIMATVYTCLAEGSHRALTLDAVARQAGVSKGMVTYYFPSKDRLIIETIEHWLKMQQRLMLEIVREPLPVRERLERLLEAVLPSRDAVRSELSFQTEVWSFAKDHPEALQALHQAYLGFRHACSDMIEVGRDEGYVTAADASWIYLLMHALIDGIAFQLVLDPDLDLAELRQRLLQLIDRLVTA